MPRTTVEIKIDDKNIDKTIKIIETILLKNKYSNKIVDNENIWLKGNGVTSSMICFSYVFTDSSIILQGWLKDIIVGELDLSMSWYGGLIKIKARNMMNEIKNAISG